jgi:RHS repeat-associated protein
MIISEAHRLAYAILRAQAAPDPVMCFEAVCLALTKNARAISSLRISRPDRFASHSPPLLRRVELWQEVVVTDGALFLAVIYACVVEAVEAATIVLAAGTARDWNQLYGSGIIANNGDPRYLENWYFAAWAYNSGIQPNAANGNTTGCTPGPACTGPDGTWGLGWTNNPTNLDYPPNRDPYLQDTYADAAHPASWPYQERVLGWTASPLIRYGSPAYAKPTYNGGQHWVQPAPFTSMCTPADNHCDPNATNPTNPGASHCLLNDFECWWHNPVTWIPSCTTTCATSPYAVSGGAEPAIEQLGAAGSFWYVHDQIGSTCALLNGSGAVAGSYRYSPYGRATATGTAKTPLQYTGQYTDTESGLVYLRARYYDPATALFLTVDPDVGSTGTPYAYTRGNPLNLTDLSGLCWSFVQWLATPVAGSPTGPSTRVNSSGKTEVGSNWGSG